MNNPAAHWSPGEHEITTALVALGTTGQIAAMIDYAYLMMPTGDGYAVTRGLAWAARGQRRPLVPEWRGLLTDGVRSAVLGVGPISLYLHPLLAAEEWEAPRCGDQVRRDAALDVLYAAAAAGVARDLVLARPGDDEDMSYLLSVPLQTPRHTWSPLARAVVRIWGNSIA